MVRAVIFDAGNTLIRMNYAAIAAHLTAYRPSISEAAVEDAELRARVRLDAHLGAGTSTETAGTKGLYLRYLLEGVGITGPAEIAAIERWRGSYNQPAGIWTVPDPEAAAALRQVRAAGVVAGVISNSNGTVRRIVEDAGLGEHLDFVIDSAVVGVEKPDPQIFQLALAEADAAPREAVYVGDLYSIDVLGARRAGLGAVLLDPRGYWGLRDCSRARGLADAARIALATDG